MEYRVPVSADSPISLGMDIGLIVALAVLALLALSFFGSALRHKGARDAMIWSLIFVGVTVVASEWDTVSRAFVPRQTTLVDGRIEVPKARDNHFHLTLQINGIPVDFLVDTGATQMVLTLDDARRIGLDPDNLAFIQTAYTANGPVATAAVTLDEVVLGEIHDTRLRASVNSGEMDKSLLGMSYLGQFESIEIRRDRLILNR